MNPIHTPENQPQPTDPIRFYLVDDDELFHLIHNRFIKSQLPHAEIINYLDPREALKEITAQLDDPRPTVLLLDVNMPYLTGWEWLDAFAAQVKKPPAWLKIFILSSSESHQDRNHALNYSFLSDYLVKPLTKASMDKISR